MHKSAYALITVLSFVGCAHQQEPAAQPGAPAPVADNTPQKEATPPAAVLASSQCQADSVCPDNQLCMNNACVVASADMCGKARVQFPFNSAQLPDSEKPALQRAARCLSGNHNMMLTIEGNADERGTEEYNLALGEQRARGVARFLKEMGAKDGQLKVISYGKDQPMCMEHDEDCWSKNRRAALKVRQVATD